MNEKLSENNITHDAVIVVSRQQASVELDGQQVILDLAQGIYYGLDRVSARVWALIQQPSRVSSVRDILLTEYEVDPDTCLNELLALLRDLATKGLLEAVDDPALGR